MKPAIRSTVFDPTPEPAPAAGTAAVTVWNPRLKDSVGFNGELVAWSGSLELYNLGHGQRIFAPNMRMFYQWDSLSPFGAGGINGYQYCHNNPVVYVDPTGHWAWTSAISIAVAVFSMAISIVTLGVALEAGAVIAAVAAGAGVAMGGASTGLHIAGLVTRSHGDTTLADHLEQASLWTGIAAAVTGFGAIGALNKAGSSVSIVMRGAQAASRTRIRGGAGVFGRMARNMGEGMELGPLGRPTASSYMSRTSGAFPMVTSTVLSAVTGSSIGKLMGLAALAGTAAAVISVGGQTWAEQRRQKEFEQTNLPPPSPYTHSQEQP
jgi:RHS repeat-associated protein